MFSHTSLRLCLFAGTAALLTACAPPESPPESASETPAEPAIEVGVDAELGTLVTTAWLSKHLGDPDLVVLDCTVRVEMTDDGGYRSVSGQADYDSGHIPGAGFADLTGALADPNSPYQFDLLPPEDFAAAMGALGVGDDTRVVLYDRYSSSWAARVWWMLRWIGFDRAALLDGGYGAWTAEERPVSTQPVVREARTLSVALRPALIADRDEVFDAIDDEGVRIVDALTPEHFSGEFSMYGRPGHIPGAVNIPAFSVIDESGHYRPREELEALFGADRAQRTITYCGGGIAASSDAFALTRLGFENVAVYTRSLQEWAKDPVNPLDEETAPADDEP